MDRKNARKWFYTTLLLLFLAIWGSYGLVREELFITNVCPKIFGIPACYIVLVSFLVALLGHLIISSWSYWMFFLPLLLVGSIALIGSIGNLTGFLQCPLTSSGIPMCYISLLTCCALLAFKYLELKA